MKKKTKSMKEAFVTDDKGRVPSDGSNAKLSTDKMRTRSDGSRVSDSKDRKFFKAEKILAKHDENYMPPEVEEALKDKY